MTAMPPMLAPTRNTRSAPWLDKKSIAASTSFQLFPSWIPPPEQPPSLQKPRKLNVRTVYPSSERMPGHGSQSSWPVSSLNP
jgi:hypothetical protein